MFSNRWGAVCHGKTTRKTCSMEDQNWHMNIIELLAMKLALLTKKIKAKSVHFQIDNSMALNVLIENGGIKEPEIHRFKQRDMTLSVFSGDHHYSRISFQSNKYSDRLPVKTEERPLRMETEFPYFSQDLGNFWKT